MSDLPRTPSKTKVLELLERWKTDLDQFTEEVKSLTYLPEETWKKTYDKMQEIDFDLYL